MKLYSCFRFNSYKNTTILLIYKSLRMMHWGRSAAIGTRVYPSSEDNCEHVYVRTFFWFIFRNRRDENYNTNRQKKKSTWKAPLKFKLQSKHIATNNRSCDECPILVAGQLNSIPIIRNGARNGFCLFLALLLSVN